MPNHTSRQETLPAYLSDLQKRMGRVERRPRNVHSPDTSYATVATPADLPPTAQTPIDASYLVISTGLVATNTPSGWVMSPAPPTGTQAPSRPTNVGWGQMAYVEAVFNSGTAVTATPLQILTRTFPSSLSRRLRVSARVQFGGGSNPSTFRAQIKHGSTVVGFDTVQSAVAGAVGMLHPVAMVETNGIAMVFNLEAYQPTGTGGVLASSTINPDFLLVEDIGPGTPVPPTAVGKARVGISRVGLY